MMIPAETAPEGLLPWVKEQKDIDWKDFLVYRAGRWTDPMTGIKGKCVDAVCTACGRSMKLAWDPEGGNKRSFGFGWYNEQGYYNHAHSYQTVECPCCGKQVKAMHISYISACDGYCWPMILEARGSALILYLWRVQRRADKEGILHWDVIPWEAYVFDQGKALKWVHWQKTFSGGTCLLAEWESRKRFTDTAYDVDIVYCPEGIEKAAMGTGMENSKLQEYMSVTDEYRFPVTWLRLYQRKPHFENLMTCPAKKLIVGMIAREKRAQSYYHTWNTNTDLLKALDHKKARPWEILRIQKEELAYFTDKEKKDGAERLKALILARKQGFSVRVGEEDPDWLRGYWKVFMDRGIDPRKAAGYMARQQRKYRKDNASNSMLVDYWDIAGWLGIDLNDPELRWPQRLKTAHDQAADRKRTMLDEKRKREAAEQAAKRAVRFEKRFEKLSRYAWEWNGISIRPARNEQELKEEGKALHHCVGTYAESHAEGRASIFFIRRAAEPDVPWYTLNFNEKELSVRMNLGNHNCKTTEEVAAFEAAWLDWVQAGAKRNDKETAA